MQLTSCSLTALEAAGSTSGTSWRVRPRLHASLSVGHRPLSRPHEAPLSPRYAPVRCPHFKSITRVMLCSNLNMQYCA